MQCSAFLAHLKFCRGRKFSFAFIGLWIAEILIAQAGYLHLEGFKWEKIADCLAAIKWYLEWSQLIKLLNGGFECTVFTLRTVWRDRRPTWWSTLCRSAWSRILTFYNYIFLMTLQLTHLDWDQSSPKYCRAKNYLVNHRIVQISLKTIFIQTLFRICLA